MSKATRRTGRSQVLVIGGVNFALLLMWIVGKSYYEAFLSPARIQREVIGRAIARHSMILSRESSFAWGEGFARWRYRVEPDVPSPRLLCGNVELSRCSFSRSRQIGAGVALTVSLSHGVLTVEEWWS
jgi:hypothetical protein